MQLWGCWPVLTDHKLVGIYSATALGTQIRASVEPRQFLLLLDTLRSQVSLWTPACVAASRPACGKNEGVALFPRSTEQPFLLGNSTEKEEVQSEMQPEEPAVPEAGEDQDIEFGLD